MKSVFGNMGTENKTERFEHEDFRKILLRQIFRLITTDLQLVTNKLNATSLEFL